MVQWRQVGCYTTFPAETDRGARTLLQRIAREIHLSEDTLLVVLLLLIGSLAGLGAAAFQSIIALGPQLWAQAQAGVGKAVIVLLPAIGGLACGLLGHLAAREGPSRGVPSILEAVALHGGRFPLRPALVRILSSILTLLSGGSAGSADPDALIGATLGSSVGRRLHLSERSLTTLVASGTASGISAAFNAPIAGVFFAIEVVLDQPSAPVLGAVVLSSVVAALVNHTLRGDFPMFRVAPYTLSGPWELVSYVGLAIIAALLGPLYTLTTTRVRSLFARLQIPGPLKPALGGLGVGLAALWLPQLLGTGNPIIEAVLVNPMGPSLLLLSALALLKPVFTSLTLGSGGAGGVFTPSLFTGAALGAAYARVLTSLFPHYSAPPGGAAMVGMGAVLAGAAHAPMTATLLLFEMTQDYDVLLPTLLATGISTLVSRVINPESVYTAPLAREGVRLREGRDVNLMEAVRVEEAMAEEWVAVEADLPLAELGDYFGQQGVDSLLVVDDRGELLGAVTASAYYDAVNASETSGSEVSDIMTTGIATIHPDQTLNDAFLLMSASPTGLVPVVPRQDGRRILGILGQGDLIRAYRSALARKQELVRRVRTMQLTGDRREAIVSLTVPEGNGATDWELGQLRLDRHQALVISVRRGGRTIIPRGDTKLQAGDVLTVAVEDEERLSAVRDLLLYGTGLDSSLRTDRAQFAIPTEVHWCERRVRDMHLQGDVLLVRIRRGSRTIIPHGDTILQPGDTVEAVGNAADLAELGTALQEPNRADAEPPSEK